MRAMAGLGKIIAHKQNPDGTYNILLEGLWRVRIDEELPPDRSYREVIAHRVRDRIAADLNEEQVRETLRSLVDKLARFIGEGGQTLLRLCAETRRLPCLIDVLSSALVPDASAAAATFRVPGSGRSRGFADGVARKTGCWLEPGRRLVA